MPLVIGAVAPHGSAIIPEASDDAGGALRTRAAMLELQRRFAAAAPDIIFITGPHSIQVQGHVSLSRAGRGAGILHVANGTLEMNVPLDIPFADAIEARATARGVPVARVGFGTVNPQASVLPLDWGIMTPAWFAGHGRNMPGAGHALADIYSGIETSPGPPLVVANPTRDIPRQLLVEFGKAVAEAAEAEERRVALIASCDWAHTHTETGIYGYHPAAKQVDELVVNAIRQDDVMSLIDLDEQLAKDAAIDGLWQLLMLEGARQVVPLTLDLLSYEQPSYYSMIVAVCERAGSG
jgi:aromatic ring-opening dioxygenase LigB subunit